MVRGAILTLVLAAHGALAAQEWPQWRGPRRDGAAATAAGRGAWPERLTRAWQASVGLGYSSPVVSGGRVFVQSREGGDEVVRALEAANGRVLWRVAHPTPYDMNPAAQSHGQGPKSTPLLHGGRLYTLGISGVLSAHDAGTGALVWRKDFAKRFAPGMPIYGAAASPMVDGGSLIVHVGTDTSGALLALDPATGAERWAWTGDGPGYASPVAVELAGVRQIVTQTRRSIVGVSVDRGTLLWQVPFATAFDQNIVTPLAWNARLILSGLDLGTFALDVTRAAGGWSTTRAWDARSVPMYMSSPVLVGDRIYGMTHRNKGQLFCLDAASGKTLWVGNGRLGDNAALLTARGAILVLTSDGELLVVTPSDAALEVARRYEVADSATWAHPAVTESGILIKDHQTLSLWTW